MISQEAGLLVGWCGGHQGKLPVPAAYLGLYHQAQEFTAKAFWEEGSEETSRMDLDLQDVKRRPILEGYVHKTLVCGQLMGRYTSKCPLPELCGVFKLHPFMPLVVAVSWCDYRCLVLCAMVTASLPLLRGLGQ